MTSRGGAIMMEKTSPSNWKIDRIKGSSQTFVGVVEVNSEQAAIQKAVDQLSVPASSDELAELLLHRPDFRGKNWAQIYAALLEHEVLKHVDRQRKALRRMHFQPRDPEATARAIIAGKENLSRRKTIRLVARKAH